MITEQERQRRIEIINEIANRKWDEFLNRPENRSELPIDLTKDQPLEGVSNEYLVGFFSEAINLKIEDTGPHIEVHSTDIRIPELVQSILLNVEGLNYSPKNIFLTSGEDNIETNKLFRLQIGKIDEVKAVLEYFKDLEIPFLSEQVNYILNNFYYIDNGHVYRYGNKDERREYVEKTKEDFKVLKQRAYTEGSITDEMLAGMIDANFGTFELVSRYADDNPQWFMKTTFNSRNNGALDRIRELLGINIGSDEILLLSGKSAESVFEIVSNYCRLKRPLGVMGKEVNRFKKAFGKTGFEVLQSQSGELEGENGYEKAIREMKEAFKRHKRAIYGKDSN